MPLVYTYIQKAKRAELAAHVPEQLSVQRYDQIKGDLLQIIINQNPRVAINTLKQQMDTDPAVLNSCHEFLHEIGFFSYKKYNDFAKALTYKDNICVSGYIHGVIEAYFSDVKNFAEAIKTACDGYPAGKFISWECYHGVGHGLMYYHDNNVLVALEGCKIYKEGYARSACSNGVYMENFNADTVIHPSRFLNPQKPYYPCNVFAQDRNHCYMNAPIYFFSLNYDYTKAADVCDSVEKKYKYACFYGLATQMTRRNMTHPEFVEQFCQNNSAIDMKACINGIVGWYVSYYASLEEAGKICSKLEDTSFCKRSVNSYKSQF